MVDYKVHFYATLFLTFLCSPFVLCMPSPASRGELLGRKDNIDERGSFVEGDMILPPGMTSRAGIIGDIFRWPNATVVYGIDKDFTEEERLLILEAFEEIEAQTCVTFRARDKELAYVFLARGGGNSGCWSLVGRLGLVQQLNLEAPGCLHKGIIMHELLHAIGFYHEQSRDDRDDFVTINWDNIQLGKESNFFKAAGGSLTLQRDLRLWKPHALLCLLLRRGSKSANNNSNRGRGPHWTADKTQ